MALCPARFIRRLAIKPVELELAIKPVELEIAHQVRFRNKG